MSKKEKEKQSKIFDGAVKEFETRCQNLSHFCCKVCVMTSDSCLILLPAGGDYL